MTLGLGAFGLFSEFQFSFQEIERADLKEQMGVESSLLSSYLLSNKNA